MWVSIVAWVVTVASSLVSLHGQLVFSSGQRGLAFAAFCGNVILMPHARDGAAAVNVSARSSGLGIWFRPSLPGRSMLLPEVRSTQNIAGKRWHAVSVPTWYFAFPPTLAFAILHRRDRRLAHRLKHTLCTRCGYSRAGIAEGAPCPECGEGSAAASKTSPE